eukprot:CAMPEP_0169470292 /NCGR_PEP_ID=MMETSP1042-20121227/23960_1 /TAXON_ID=464988 /ORGANISM="Hemiselmis andersenii, Strain CCMP1180" /LENGTH=75 /DNA_ID=CAMNT_0009583875 /DNA_START=27 /DNA_END=250 /DNA_ORIENTATION=+
MGYKDGRDSYEPNIKKFFKKRGVDPDRIVFSSLFDKDVHLQAKSHANLLLDTHPYNGHMTVAEALWAGVPVVTFP